MPRKVHRERERERERGVCKTAVVTLALCSVNKRMAMAAGDFEARLATLRLHRRRSATAAEGDVEEDEAEEAEAAEAGGESEELAAAPRGERHGHGEGGERGGTQVPAIHPPRGGEHTEFHLCDTTHALLDAAECLAELCRRCEPGAHYHAHVHSRYIY